MIATLTIWRWAVHIGYPTYLIGDANRRKHYYSTSISPMWRLTCSVSYHMLVECRQVFPWLRCYWLEEVKYHKYNPSWKGYCPAVRSCQSWDLAGTDTELDTTNTEKHMEMMIDAGKRKLHRMAKVYYVVEMWQGSQNLCITRKESRAQNTPMIAIAYIWTLNRLSNHPGYTFNIMVQLHLNCQKDYPCCQLSVQRTSQKDALK